MFTSDCRFKTQLTWYFRVELPELKEVRGQFNMQSSGELNCEPFEKDVKSNVRGKFTCKGNVDDPQSSDPSRTGGKPSKSSSAAIAGAVPASGMTVLALLGAIARLVL